MQTRRTDSQHPDFQQLVSLLDEELAIRDGEEHAFYHQFNGIDTLKHCVVCYIEDEAVGCGAFKQFDQNSVEIKRMYTRSNYRGKGVARSILTTLEGWASELGFSRAILETGVRQPEAIGLYSNSGFARTTNYGQYAGVENSLCFEKRLK